MLGQDVDFSMRRAEIARHDLVPMRAQVGCGRILTPCTDALISTRCHGRRAPARVFMVQSTQRHVKPHAE